MTCQPTSAMRSSPSWALSKKRLSRRWSRGQSALSRAIDALKAELIEIAENLHPLDLSKEQRDEHIRRYAELLTDAAKVVPQGILSKPTTGRGNKGVARQIADEFGLTKKVVQHALAPKSAPEPKSALPDYDVVTVRFNALVSAWITRRRRRPGLASSLGNRRNHMDCNPENSCRSGNSRSSDSCTHN